MPGFGMAGWIAVAAIAVVLVVLAVLHFGFHVFRRRRPRRHPRQADVAGHGRVEVLETTPIDAERRLVLVRCDGIEHLIMIGGPADVVVENDVKKVRGPAASPAKTPIPEFEKRTAPAARTPLTTPTQTLLPPSGKAADAARPSARITDGRQAGAAPRSGLAAILPTPARTGAASSRSGELASGSGAKADDPAAARSAPHRPQADSQFNWRDTSSPRRVPQIQPTPQHGSRLSDTPRPAGASSSDRGGRLARGNSRAAEEPAALPAAQIPWSDPDSIENEIVRALKFDPEIRAGESSSSSRRDLAAKPAMDSSTTLGDLADRLEEALAREVQSASHARKVDIDLEDFGFDAGEPAKPAPRERERPERRERSETLRSTNTTQPDTESRREPESRRESASSERREEAPVISLNARRRESSDALEDEMARLLGELTGDTKGR